MPLNRKVFFDEIRKAPFFDGYLGVSTVRGIHAILDEWDRSGLTDTRFLAYMLATVLGECGRNMLPVREGFKKTDEEARADVKSKRRKYARVIKGNVYYGRGLVQLTWYENYVDMGKLLNLDLVGNPDLALDPAIATKIMFAGMTQGTFTHHKLADYFNSTSTNWVGARQIINKLDRAEEISDYAQQFYKAIQAAVKAPAPVVIDQPKAPDKPKIPVDTIPPVTGIGAGFAGWVAGFAWWQIALLVVAALAAGYGLTWLYKQRG